jgi:hypothetical protein
MVVAHTACRIVADHEPEVHDAVGRAGSPDTSDIAFLSTPDQVATLIEDVERLRSSPYFKSTVVGGFVYDLETRRITQLV